MKRKIIIGLILLILLVGFVVGAIIPKDDWDFKDFYNIFNVNNITSKNITADNFFGNLSWNYLKNYPVACPASSAITQLGDSVVCTSFVPYIGANANQYKQQQAGQENANFNQMFNQQFVQQNPQMNPQFGMQGMQGQQQ